MPSRVHALLVVRPEGRAAPDIHLRRTLAALGVAWAGAGLQSTVTGSFQAS